MGSFFIANKPQLLYFSPMLRVVFFALFIISNFCGSYAHAFTFEPGTETEIHLIDSTHEDCTSNDCPDEDCCQHCHLQPFIASELTLLIPHFSEFLKFLDQVSSVPEKFYEISKPPMV